MLVGAEQGGADLPPHRRRWLWTEGTETSDSWKENSGGWYLREASNGDLPVAAQVKALREYSTQGRSPLQEVGWRAETQSRADSRLWLARSAWPFVCGWYPEERLMVAPIPLQKACQT